MSSAIFASNADSLHVLPAEVQKNTAAELIRSGRSEELFDQFITGSIDLMGKLLIALILFYVGKWMIKRIARFSGKVFEKRIEDIALRSFLMNMLNITLFVTLIIVIINIVGTKTVSIAALIGSVGLALGLAVKDNLANKTIHIPNGPLSTGNIVNFNTQATRRVDLTVNVDYGSDVELVKRLLLEIADRHPLILKEPAPFSRMVKMNDSSIDFALRVWTARDDFWTVTYDLNEQTYETFNAQGLNIPFPQMTVHMAKDSLTSENK